ncbi:AI-2E family transporter [Erythrobacter mangrovi]|uniref:AI-2E family transporter n=1 Tax=Erythrobacter mangrovi TaxID=2739433 RepID=A0A7D4B7U8_9SPHN|nr:AI-2E family transporter [Erythrobacter mangrovi]QKG69941.1 AI-2E family transporter [Erythrobacter mangrovi]
MPEFDEHDLGSSPSRISDPRLRHEVNRALVWAAVIGGVALAVAIARPLLAIFGAMVFAAIIDGGARLLGRIMPIGRIWRVALVLFAGVAFMVWLASFAGATIAQEAEQFPAILERQLGELIAMARERGIDINQAQIQNYAVNFTSGIGTVTKALGGILGGFATVLLIIVIGIYLAIDPQLYERGVAWMLPRHRRESFYLVVDRMSLTMRRLMGGRLLGMVVEAVFTYLMLTLVAQLLGIGTVPMAALLAILTGLLAFIPNLGALVSGVLMVMVGFSGGVDMGLYTIFVYFFVQNFDGYVVIPMIAKKTVDLAPALVLSFQLIMGLLFGIIGLFLADPLLAMIKVALERRAEIAGLEERAKVAKNGA